MRWPDLFFKTRKRPEEKAPRAPAPPVTQAPSSKKPEAVAPVEAPVAIKIEAPAQTPPAKPTPESVERAMNEADPLYALSRTVGVHLMKRAPLDAPAQTGPILAKTSGKAPAADPVAPPSTSAKTEVAHEPFILTPGAAPTPPVKLPPPGATNLRRKAKLIDLARMVAPPPPPDPPVVPPAFPVAVPTGQVLPAESPFVAQAANPPSPEIQVTPASSEKVPTEPAPQAPPPPTEAKPMEALPVVAKDRKEFLLTNGERIYGRILSENDEAVYLEHGTLGVLTLPRSQIAKRPVEIILINGDRIVGDIMAETHDTLYIRHASLGMLTVPRSHRSARVVEAILKDGDRILGEVLTETDTFTIIRSASLGTVTVPHQQVAMMNRKIEQIELKAVPALGAPGADKSSV